VPRAPRRETDIAKRTLDPRIARVIERWVAAASARPRATLAALGVVTVLLALGWPSLRFETGILDWLPESHPNVRAFGRMLEKLDGITNQELLWVELDPEKAQRAGVESIVDPDAVRAQAELIAYVRGRVPRIRHAFGLPHWFSLARQASRGGDPGAFGLPESDFEYGVLWRTLYSVNRELLDPTIAQDRRATYVGLVVEGDPLTRLARDVGVEVQEAVAAYRADPDREHDLFRDDLLVPVGLASGTAFLDRTLREDVSRLAPIAAALVVASLLVAFRRPGRVVAGIAQVATGVVWTYGAMGHAGAPVNIVNVALVPLVFGCGVDYAIHFLNEYGRHARGEPHRALRAAARTSGVGIFLTTVTTATGLASLVLADLPGMAVLGAFAALGMVSLAVLSLTFLPAWLALRERGAPTGGRALVPVNRPYAAVLEWLARHRVVAIVLFVAITGGLGAFVGKPLRMLDPIRGNYRPSERVAQVVERMKARARGAFPEFLIFEGDLADPAVVERVARVGRAVEASPLLEEGAAVATYADVVGARTLLDGDLASTARRFLETGGELARSVPGSREEIDRTMRELHENPSWEPLAGLFFDRGRRIAVALVLLDEPFSRLDRARELFAELERIAADASDDELAVSFLGYRTMSYLFLAESLRWLRILFLVSLGVAVAGVALFLRDRRAVVAVAILMVATGVWWVGLLRLVGLSLTVFLLFPLVFIVCIGSDYALHLCWRLSRGERRLHVFATAGRAVLYSAVTDAAVFLLFAFGRLVSASQVMLAVVLAVISIFLSTTLLVPAVYSRPKSGAPREGVASGALAKN